MGKEMTNEERAEFMKFIEEAMKLTDENKRLLQAYINGMLAVSKRSA